MLNARLKALGFRRGNQGVKPQSKGLRAEGQGPKRKAVAVQTGRRVTDRRKALGWQEEDLNARRKGGPQTVSLAAAMRVRTTLPPAWLANRPGLGSRDCLPWRRPRPSRRHNIGGNFLVTIQPTLPRMGWKHNNTNGTPE